MKIFSLKMLSVAVLLTSVLCSTPKSVFATDTETPTTAKEKIKEVTVYFTEDYVNDGNAPTRGPDFESTNRNAKYTFELREEGKNRGFHHGFHSGGVTGHNPNEEVIAIDFKNFDEKNNDGIRYFQFGTWLHNPINNEKFLWNWSDLESYPLFKVVDNGTKIVAPDGRDLSEHPEIAFETDTDAPGVGKYRLYINLNKRYTTVEFPIKLKNKDGVAVSAEQLNQDLLNTPGGLVLERKNGGTGKFELFRKFENQDLAADNIRVVNESIDGIVTSVLFLDKMIYGNYRLKVSDDFKYQLQDDREFTVNAKVQSTRKDGALTFEHKALSVPIKKVYDSKKVLIENNDRIKQHIESMQFGVFKDGQEVSNALEVVNNTIQVKPLALGSYEIKQKKENISKVNWGSKANQSLPFEVIDEAPYYRLLRDMDPDDMSAHVASWSMRNDDGKITELDGLEARDISNEVSLGIYENNQKLRSTSDCEGIQRMSCLFNNLDPFKTYAVEIENPEDSLYEIQKHVQSDNQYNVEWFSQEYANKLNITGSEIVNAEASNRNWGAVKNGNQNAFLKRIADRFEIPLKMEEPFDNVEDQLQFSLEKDGVPVENSFTITNESLQFNKLPIGNYTLSVTALEDSKLEVNEYQRNIVVNEQGYVNNEAKNPMFFTQKVRVASLTWSNPFTSGPVEMSMLKSLKAYALTPNGEVQVRSDLENGDVFIKTHEGAESYRIEYSVKNHEKYEEIGALSAFTYTKDRTPYSIILNEIRQKEDKEVLLMVEDQPLGENETIHFELFDELENSVENQEIHLTRTGNRLKFQDLKPGSYYLKLSQSEQSNFEMLNSTEKVLTVDANGEVEAKDIIQLRSVKVEAVDEAETIQIIDETNPIVIEKSKEVVDLNTKGDVKAKETVKTPKLVEESRVAQVDEDDSNKPPVNQASKNNTEQVQVKQADEPVSPQSENVLPKTGRGNNLVLIASLCVGMGLCFIAIQKLINKKKILK